MLCLALVYALSRPDAPSSVVRMRVDSAVRGPAAAPAPLFTAPGGSIHPDSGSRRKANLTAREPAAFAHGGFAPGGILRLERGEVQVQTAHGPVAIGRLRHAARFISGVSEESLFAEQLLSLSSMSPVAGAHGEPLDSLGLPVRWSSSAQAETPSPYLECRIDLTQDRSLQLLAMRLGVPPGEHTRSFQAGKYREYVEKYAAQYNLTTALVLAIMRTESNFNPFAISSSRAVGLMQVVPETAGNEAHRFLTGARGAPSLETLLTPEHNIKYGTTYLHLLGSRYFGKVINPRSREICIIAAYNGGPGAVLRVFSTNQDLAVARINAMAPAEVYEKLTTAMPTLESRRYIRVVLGHMRSFHAP